MLAGRSWRWRVAALTLFGVVALHFTTIGLLIGAPWAVPRPLLAATSWYLQPWFSQDWRLFAPVPDLHDYAVYVRGQYRDGPRLAETPWLAVLDPLVATVQSNRLSPRGARLEIAHKAALYSVRAASPLGMLPSGREALARQWETVDRQPGSVIALERLGSVLLAETYPDRSFETVQLMVTARRVARDGGPGPEEIAVGFVLRPIPFQQVGP